MSGFRGQGKQLASPSVNDALEVWPAYNII